MIVSLPIVARAMAAPYAFLEERFGWTRHAAAAIVALGAAVLRLA